MRVTITIEGDELGDVTVTRENRIRSLGASEGPELLEDLLDNAIGQAVCAYGLDRKA